MPALMLSFIAASLAGLGNRDQLLLASVSDRLGRSRALLAVAWACSALSAVAMSWAGAELTALMPGPAQTMLIAFALLIAAVELAWAVKFPTIKEPTHSLGAAFIVLLARQIGDAPRFLIFALAAGMGAPVMAAIGGALGGGLSMTLAWQAGAAEMRGWPLSKMRRSLAAIVAVAAVYVGMSARGIV